GKLQEYLYQFPGFYVQSRTLRRYPRPIAAHVLGDVGEVSESEIARNPYYQMGDYIGKSGLEKYYEEQLRGKKGVKVVMVDVLNREKGSYKGGMFDTVAVSGHELYSTLDASLQAYAEELMYGKRGSIVAIEPSTGEVLALVSAPTYDPNLLIGRVRSANYRVLLNDVQKPLFNRALMAYYPPGSIFKLPQALIGMQEKVITPYSGFACDKSTVGCHNHPDAMSVAEGVRMSCNPYFYQVFRRIIMRGKDPNRFVDSRMGLERWDTLIRSFGLGQRLGIDLSDAKAGFIPDAAYYDRYYGRNQWAFSTIFSVSIGQGEIGLIPLQMANLASIMANRGYYRVPHLVRFIGEDKQVSPFVDTSAHYVPIDRKYFDPVVEGMYGAVHLPGGTARRAYIDTIPVCGKTGTSQNPHGKDHAVFIGFAPQDNPRIAISVFLENSGFGGTWA
ncbi:MAG: penicillin-binding protein 2, partial [Bacteroidales bacterium]|nr:penicillin-binding protein 2 [Bacteroidales bacterium]